MAKKESEAIYIYSITRAKYEVKIKGGDSFYDFAVLEFVTPPGSEITTTKFSDDEPKVGQKVYAIGNPLAEYPYTVTDGIISAKNRMRQGMVGKFGYIQSTATIIWGNSGGPLVNEKGDVVGVNSYIAFGPEDRGSVWQSQINFALEAATCKRLVNDILTNDGRVRRAFVGVEIAQNYDVVNDYYTQKASLQKRDNTPMITNVFLNSPAYNQLNGKTGYALVAVNGTEVRNIEEALGEFEGIKPGSQVKLTISKNGSKENVSLTAKELEPSILAGLAQSMIENDPSYKITSTSGEVDISYKQAYERTYEQRYNNRWQGTNEYKVMGIGEVSDKSTDVWRVNSMDDLGAALRFYGLMGFYDLVTLDKMNPNAKPQKATIYFSGDQNVIKRTVWY